MVKVSDTVDYAAHELHVKRMLKDAQVSLLDNQYQKAADILDLAIVELRLMRTAVKSYVK